MSVKHLTPAIIDRTVYVIDRSGIVDALCPERPTGQRGRKGKQRENTRLWCIGVRLCTALGHETTIRGVHQVLTEALSREDQWRLGVLRPKTAKTPRDKKTGEIKHKPSSAAKLGFTQWGKPRKLILDDLIEQVGYDDLWNAVEAVQKRLNYGAGSAAGLEPEERLRRQLIVESIADALIAITTIDRAGSIFAIDATGQWAWTRGPQKIKEALEDKAKKAKQNNDPAALEELPIAIDDDGGTAPEQQAAPPAAARGICLDAAWGYRTEKDGRRGPGFGFHQHTIVRVPDPFALGEPEPVLVDGFVITPANADVVDESLHLIDRIMRRHNDFKTLLADLLYTNLKADRWAYPLAQRGVEQVLGMRSDNHKTLDVHGAILQYSWLHCPAAPIDQRPQLPDFNGTKQEWEEATKAVEEFRRNWAFTRKVSGLGPDLTTKWICPKYDDRVGCTSMGKVEFEVAREAGLPLVDAPEDWESRKCCTQKIVTFIPDAADHNHQRKLAQREYFGGKRWRRLSMARGRVEGVFGILKNPSRQRMKRGQNRLPGLAIATILAAIKISLFNEEQLRNWHARSGIGPADHPLLQPDPEYYGYGHLTKDDADSIDAKWLGLTRAPKQDDRAA